VLCAWLQGMACVRVVPVMWSASGWQAVVLLGRGARRAARSRGGCWQHLQWSRCTCWVPVAGLASTKNRPRYYDDHPDVAAISAEAGAARRGSQVASRPGGTGAAGGAAGVSPAAAAAAAAAAEVVQVAGQRHLARERLCALAGGSSCPRKLGKMHVAMGRGQAGLGGLCGFGEAPDSEAEGGAGGMACGPLTSRVGRA